MSQNSSNYALRFLENFANPNIVQNIQSYFDRTGKNTLFRENPTNEDVELFWSLPRFDFTNYFFNPTLIKKFESNVQGISNYFKLQNDCQEVLPRTLSELWAQYLMTEKSEIKIIECSTASYEPSFLLDIRNALDTENYETLDSKILEMVESLGIFQSALVNSFLVKKTSTEGEIRLLSASTHPTTGLVSRMYKIGNKELETYWDLNSMEIPNIEFNESLHSMK